MFSTPSNYSGALESDIAEYQYLPLNQPQFVHSILSARQPSTRQYDALPSVPYYQYKTPEQKSHLPLYTLSNSPRNDNPPNPRPAPPSPPYPARKKNLPDPRYQYQEAPGSDAAYASQGNKKTGSGKELCRCGGKKGSCKSTRNFTEYGLFSPTRFPNSDEHTGQRNSSRSQIIIYAACPSSRPLHQSSGRNNISITHIPHCASHPPSHSFPLRYPYNTPHKPKPAPVPASAILHSLPYSLSTSPR